jgi:hypothetical protein
MDSLLSKPHRLLILDLRLQDCESGAFVLMTVGLLSVDWKVSVSPSQLDASSAGWEFCPLLSGTEVEQAMSSAYTFQEMKGKMQRLRYVMGMW